MIGLYFLGRKLLERNLNKRMERAIKERRLRSEAAGNVV